MYKIINSIKTIEQYNKKYRNYRHSLVVLTKKEVDEFDLLNNCKGEKRLLNNKSWVLIKDTYYEIPKPIRWTWFRNLNAGVQTVTSVLLVGAVGSAIAVPTYMMLKNNGGVINRNIIIDSNDVTSKVKIDNIGNLSGKLTIKNPNNEFSGIDVSIGSSKLNEDEYTFDTDTGEVLVKADVLAKYSGDICIKPILVEVPGTEITESTTFDASLNEVCEINENSNYSFSQKTVNAKNDVTNSEEFISTSTANVYGYSQEIIENNDDKYYYFSYGDDNIYTIYFGEWVKTTEGFGSDRYLSLLKNAIGKFNDFTYSNGVHKAKITCSIYGTDFDVDFTLKFDENNNLIRAQISFDYEWSTITTRTDYFKFYDYSTTEEITFPIPLPQKELVITLNNSEIDFDPDAGTTYQIGATFKDESVISDLAFTTLPTDVITVSNTGVITPVIPTPPDIPTGGSVEITIKGNEHHESEYAQKSINVEVASFKHLNFVADETYGYVPTLKDEDPSTYITIPKSKIMGNVSFPITAIKANAFNSSTTLTSVCVPSSVRYISADSFNAALGKAYFNPEITAGWHTYDADGELLQFIDTAKLTDPDTFAQLLTGKLSGITPFSYLYCRGYN